MSDLIIDIGGMVAIGMVILSLALGFYACCRACGPAARGHKAAALIDLAIDGSLRGSLPFDLIELAAGETRSGAGVTRTKPGPQA
jgi:hypothetical protein